MKLLFAIASVFFLNSSHAQQVFQGSILYTLHVPQEKNDAELLIMYGPNKIKLKFKEKEDYDKTYLIVDLDSSKFFIVNNDEKTFQIKKLAEIFSGETVSSKTIAGHTTTPVNVSSSFSLGSIFGAGGSTTVLFASTDLYYPVPKKHAGIPELTMIQNDHIVLGADIKMEGSQGMSDKLPDSILQQMKVSIEATKITPQNFDITEFSIPVDFALKSIENWSTTTIEGTSGDSVRPDFTDTTAYDPSLDSVAMMTDTTAVPPPPKKKINTNSKPATPKKTTSTKTEAIKPKKTTTKS